MSDPKWQAKELDLKEVMQYVRHMGAPSTREIKFHFTTDSGSVRKAMGRLMILNKVFPMPFGRGVAYVPVTGKQGYPDPKRARREAPGYQPSSRSKKKGVSEGSKPDLEIGTPEWEAARERDKQRIRQLLKDQGREGEAGKI